MIHELNIPVSVSTAQCQAVLTTATDMGEINYWELPFRNRQRTEGLDCISLEVRCDDAPSITGYIDESWALIDEHTVVNGLKLIAEGKVKINQQLRSAILAHAGSKDDGIDYCDAEMADVILQVGLFGEIVYG